MRFKSLFVALFALLPLVCVADESFMDTSVWHVFTDWTSTNVGQASSTSTCTYTFASLEESEISFDWKVSSESGWDKLSVRLDGVLVVDGVSGERSGSYTKTFTGAGTHTLVCSYSKDSSRNGGSDQAFITNVVLIHPPYRPLYGDMNQDGKISVGDIAQLTDIAAGKSKPMYMVSAAEFIKENKLTGKYVVNGKIIRVDGGKITNDAEVPLVSDKKICTETDDSDYILDTNGYDYVDLGLPSGTLWATANVGTTSPYGDGEYFSWGEKARFMTEKILFYWKDYKYYDAETQKYTKYINNSFYGPVDNKMILDPEDDAAHVIMGGDWRMPTIAEVDELVNPHYTTTTWFAKGVFNYLKIASKNDDSKYIILSAAGQHRENKTEYYGTIGKYWTSELHPDGGTEYPCYLEFTEHTCGRHSGSYRYVGLPIRAVCAPPKK